MEHLQKLPENPGLYYENIDPQNMYRMMLSGFYEQSIQIGNKDINFVVYYPEDLEQSCRALYLIADRQSELTEFCALSGWQAAADKHKFMIIASKEQFNKEVTDLFFEEWIKCHETKTYYNILKTCIYIAGYGSGAEYAVRLALRHPQVFAGVGCMGECNISQKELNDIGECSSDVDYVLLKEVPMPAMFWVTHMNEGHKRLLNYWREANKSEEKPYVQNKIQVYLPDVKKHKYYVNEQPVAKIYVVETEQDSCTPENAEMIWEHLLSYATRAVALYNGNLHPYRTVEQWGMKVKYLDVDGFRRHWLEYIPGLSKRNKDYKAPLVIFLHGGSNMASSAVLASEWPVVAEARDFVLACPTGTMRRFEDRLPHPAWNASDAKDIQDDLKFIRLMIEEIEKRELIDKSRIYVTGHSMGAAMTQRVALTMPEIIAAAASNSGVVNGGFLGDFGLPGIKEGLDMPMWIQMGQKDVGGGTFEENANAKKTVEYWINRNGTDSIEHAKEYVNGRFHNKVWFNEKNIPMVTYTTTREKPHAMTPEDAWIYYDDFFSKFRRLEDGSSAYIGKKTR